MASGIVVDHKESGVRYAVSTHNFNDKIHKKVRDLKPGETVLGFQPKPKGDQGSPAPTAIPAGEQASLSGDSHQDTKTTHKPGSPETK